MSLFTRNLAKYGQFIDIQTRESPGAPLGETDITESFVTKHNVKAIVKTPKGKATFDDVGLDATVTHKFVISWLDGISQEDWILFKERRFDILNDMNCCEADQVITMFCVERGKGEAAKA